MATYGGDTTERRALLAASRAPLLILRGARSKILSAEMVMNEAKDGIYPSDHFGIQATLSLP